MSRKLASHQLLWRKIKSSLPFRRRHRLVKRNNLIFESRRNNFEIDGLARFEFNSGNGKQKLINFSGQMSAMLAGNRIKTMGVITVGIPVNWLKLGMLMDSWKLETANWLDDEKCPVYLMNAKIKPRHPPRIGKHNFPFQDIGFPVRGLRKFRRGYQLARQKITSEISKKQKSGKRGRLII